jgi:hypothetical protein
VLSRLSRDPARFVRADGQERGWWALRRWPRPKRRQGEQTPGRQFAEALTALDTHHSLLEQRQAKLDLWRRRRDLIQTRIDNGERDEGTLEMAQSIEGEVRKNEARLAASLRDTVNALNRARDAQAALGDRAGKYPALPPGVDRTIARMVFDLEGRSPRLLQESLPWVPTEGGEDLQADDRS